MRKNIIHILIFIISFIWIIYSVTFIDKISNNYAEYCISTCSNHLQWIHHVKSTEFLTITTLGLPGLIFLYIRSLLHSTGFFFPSVQDLIIWIILWLLETMAIYKIVVWIINKFTKF